MIKVGDKYLRNLEEQVQYLTNYHDVNQGLVQWGIRVVGQVEVEGDLPLPYDGEYGDAIAVGTQAPFFFYIWTRASIEGGNAYWFPFGEISTVGPVGPVGPKGEKGDNGHSAMWYSGSDVPNSSSQVYVDGDMYLQTNGQVYKYQNGSWQSVVNIRGPQGIQGIQGIQGPQGLRGILGPKGDRGDVGGFINIKGILHDVNQLPLPSTLSNLSVAYLIGASEPYDLYIQVGNTSEDAIWTNTGPFNVATMVTVDGEYQNIWDADVKVDKSELNKYLSKAEFNLENGEGIDSIVLRYTGEVDDTHFGNTNTGKSSVVFGEANNNYANRALLAGKLNNNSGANAIVGGLRNTVKATNGITIGSVNTIEESAIRSVTAGYNNTNSGEDSIQTGTSNKNYGIGSAEFGCLHINHGHYSALIGSGNINRGGNYSALIGVNLRNEQQNEDGTYNTKVIVGRWNEDKLENVFEVGNGTSNAERSNAFEVLRDGHAQVGRSTINTDNGLTIVTKDYADTKLEKDTSVTTYNQVYVKSAGGGQGSINVTKQVVADAIPQRQSDGNIYVPETPAENIDAASKGYVDTQVSSLSTQVSTTYQPKLTAGTGVTISGNTISAEGKTYTAGSGISISDDGVISNTRSAGTTKYLHNITFQVDAGSPMAVSFQILNTAYSAYTTVAQIRGALSNFTTYNLPASGAYGSYPIVGVRQAGTSSAPAIEVFYYAGSSLNSKQIDADDISTFKDIVL